MRVSQSLIRSNRRPIRNPKDGAGLCGLAGPTRAVRKGVTMEEPIVSALRQRADPPPEWRIPLLLLGV